MLKIKMFLEKYYKICAHKLIMIKGLSFLLE